MDPLLSLAFNMHSNKGAHAFLLGSGVSRSAGIPSGWEVVLDLIRRVAVLHSEDPGLQPDEWYAAKFDEAPNYSKLIEMLAPTRAERNRVLRRYFEPTQEERETGLKVPQPAHHAIAKLAQGGYIKVIITTNFDPLIEQALQAAGVPQTVLSTPDAVVGALPLHLSPVIVLKVNGDYRDTRILNTTGELERYDTTMESMLDKILDDYGLVVCGWSAEWDIALCSAIDRAPNRRFTTYWASRNDLADKAKKLAEQRAAQPIEIKDADSFFLQLQERVEALEEIDRPHPLSAAVAAATAKQYLAEDRFRIKLHDLVFGETEKLVATVTELLPGQNVTPDGPLLQKLIHEMEAASEVLLAIFMPGCVWAKGEQVSFFTDSLQRLFNFFPIGGGYTAWREISKYPAMLLLYTGGIGSLSRGSWSNVVSLLSIPKVTIYDGTQYSVAEGLSNNLQTFLAVSREFKPNRVAAASEYLQEILRGPLHDEISGDHDFLDWFDRFEYLLALSCADSTLAADKPLRATIGTFAWRHTESPGRTASEWLVELMEQFQGELPLLRGGLFGSDLVRMKRAKYAVDELCKQLRYQHF